MVSTISEYFAALNTLDRARYLACFTEDTVLRDPYGGPVLEGEGGLNKFFDGLERTWQSFDMQPADAFASGDRVAVLWKTEAVAHSGKQAQFTGVNVFTLAGDKISRLDGYWDFRAMIAQIK